MFVHRFPNFCSGRYSFVGWRLSEVEMPTPAALFVKVRSNSSTQVLAEITEVFLADGFLHQVLKAA